MSLRQNVKIDVSKDRPLCMRRAVIHESSVRQTAANLLLTRRTSLPLLILCQVRRYPFIPVRGVRHRGSEQQNDPAQCVTLGPAYPESNKAALLAQSRLSPFLQKKNCKFTRQIQLTNNSHPVFITQTTLSTARVNSPFSLYYRRND